MQNSKSKRLENIDLLFTLPFHEELSVVKTNKAFRGYEMIYKVELIDKKDPLSQLKTSKSSIKNLFNDLLVETKYFKYQITVKILLKKYKGPEIKFSPVYFSSTAKTMINHKFDLEKAFQKTLYGIDN